jgi:hypothetical protein
MCSPGTGFGIFERLTKDAARPAAVRIYLRHYLTQSLLTLLPFVNGTGRNPSDEFGSFATRHCKKFTILVPRNFPRLQSMLYKRLIRSVVRLLRIDACAEIAQVTSWINVKHTASLL